MNKTLTTLFASAILVDTAFCSPTSEHPAVLPEATVSRLADAIFRAENSRKHPYGVMIPTDNPRRVCCNTINHAWKDFEREHKPKAGSSKLSSIAISPTSLPFIQFLGARYCPPSVDSVGYKHWTNNVWRIYNKQ